MKKSTSIFWGIMFVLGGIVGIVQVSVLSGIICLIIGILLLCPFKHEEKSDSDHLTPHKQEEKSTDNLQHHNSNLEKSFTFPIVGVTFKNDDGTERQWLLRKIYFKDPPFKDEQNVILERYLWNDSPAYHIKVNGYIVGYISSDMVWYFEENSNRPYKIEYIKVYGGGNDKKYGAEIHGIYLDV